MRYKVLLSYMGTNYSGWQKQPGDRTIQETLENAFSTVLREPIELVGCGRTDAGVHARGYFAHFDATEIPDVFKIVYRVNAVLPPDIAVWTIQPTHPEFHARYDAIERAYSYSFHFMKDPFLHNKSFYLVRQADLNQDIAMEVADLILKYDEFLPFCKTGSDQTSYRCSIKQSVLTFESNYCSYTISSNRFLRGMVRLIVGACLNAGFGKLSVGTIRECLEIQKPLPLQWSVPPEGLCLDYVFYPPPKTGWVAYPPEG